MNKEAVFENIKSRYTCRRFKPDPVPDELLREIIDAAKHAPSGHNEQGWHFSIVRTPENRAELIKAAGEEAPDMFKKMWPNASWPFQPGCENAPVIVLISRRSDVPWPEVGPLLAAQNLLLAANAVGLGAMWSTVFSKDLFTAGGTAAMRDKFIPPEYSLCAGILIGYPQGNPPSRHSIKDGAETWL